MTPKSCACPLSDRQKKTEEVFKCDCCTHKSQYDVTWNKRVFCEDGEKCIFSLFPNYINNNWWLMQKSLVFQGLGVPSIDTNAWKFWVQDYFDFPHDSWGEIMNFTDELFRFYVSLIFSENKKKKIVFKDTDIKKIKEINEELTRPL